MLLTTVILLASVASGASAAIVNLGRETFGMPSCGSGSIDNPVNSSECQAAIAVVFEEVCSGGVCELTTVELGSSHTILAAIDTCEVLIKFEGNFDGVTFNQQPVSAALGALVASCNKPFLSGESSSPAVLSVDGQLQLSYKTIVPQDG
jgi:hypothetical protein